MAGKVLAKTKSGKPIFTAYQFHPTFDDWTATDHEDAADAHLAAVKTDIKTNASMHKTSAEFHRGQAKALYRAIDALGLKGPKEAVEEMRATAYSPRFASWRLEDYAPPPFYLEMVKHPSDVLIWFLATAETKQGYKGLQVEHWLGERKPKKAVQKTIQRLEINQGYWKKVKKSDLPSEVLNRFAERSSELPEASLINQMHNLLGDSLTIDSPYATYGGMTTESSDVADTIAKQMGGVGRIRLMLGRTTKVMALENGLSIKWPNKERSRGNYVEVVLRPDDTYDMTFFNLSGASKKEVKKYEMIYFDQLTKLFRDHTGWALTL